MKIAIMQPYFFPYLGYFGLIKNTDKWIVFDTPQFIYHGWIERNRIINSNEGWQYIQVPLYKHSRSCLIKDIKIDIKENWSDKIFAKLTVYKNIAKYYNEIIELLKKIFDYRTDSITKLNCYAIQEVCKYLGIKWNYEIFSEMELEIEKPNSPDEWALNICKKLKNIDEYWNLPGGLGFFDKTKYHESNIKIKFYSQKLLPYNQRRKLFESGLSIIDVLMFNSVNEINNMLMQYEIL